MKKIPIHGKHGQGKFALVDDEDFDRINAHKWFAQVTSCGIYAYRIVRRNGKYICHVRMHREVMNAPKGLVVDHHFHNTLDNRKFVNGQPNLIISTVSENGANRLLGSNNKTGYKGVVEVKGLYRAFGKIKGKKHSIGVYNEPWEAAVAYNHFMKENFPQHFKPNPIPNWENIHPQKRDKDNYIRRDSKTGIRGIVERNGKYRARKHIKGRNFDSGGYHDTPEKAVKALQRNIDNYLSGRS